MSKHLGFVYGTLKEGQINHRQLLYGTGTTKIGVASTVKNFLMFDGRYPRVACPSYARKLKKYSGKVEGEVYEFGDEVLSICDRLEGHPDFYTRKKVSVELHSGERVKVWMYLITKGYIYRPIDTAVIPQIFRGERYLRWDSDRLSDRVNP